MTTLNVPLLRKALEHITAHPEEWNQGTWIEQTTCGTACCVAGHVVLMTGHKAQFPSEDLDENGRTTETLADGRHVADVAAEELGLDRAQAGGLFSPLNELDDLWEIAEELSDGEIVAPVLAEIH